MLSFLIRLFNRLDKPAIENRLLLGQMFSQDLRGKKHVKNLSEVEFKVFSEHREDGIIQYLIQRVLIKNKAFVEFGVGDYRESNTRFLLMNDRWKGLVMEGEKKLVSRIRSYDFYWRHNLTAIQAFVTRENINGLLKFHGFTGDIGLLSIDVDGNDYWIWEAMTEVRPRIVICEYNSVFGKNHAVTIPYDANFNRTKAHYSNLFFGASLKALCLLAEKKKYKFAGVDSSGTNAFFVRNDAAQQIRRSTCEEAYLEAVARESRDQRGNLTLKSGIDRLSTIANMKVFDVLSGKEVYLRDMIS